MQMDNNKQHLYLAPCKRIAQADRNPATYHAPCDCPNGGPLEQPR